MLISLLGLTALYYLAVDRQVALRLQQPLLQMLVGASVCALTVLWQIKAQLPGWPTIHFLGITSLVLVLGLRLGLVAIASTFGLQLLFLSLTAQGLPADMAEWLWRWLLLALTATCSYGVYLLVDRWLSRDFFHVIFAGCFLNALVCTMLFYGVSIALARSDHGIELSIDDGFLLTLIAFPEALLNGMAMTLFVVYRPHWVSVLRMSIFER